TIGHTIYRQALKFIPGAGSIIGGTVASSMTLALGYGVKYAYENNIAIDYDMLGDIFEKLKYRDENGLSLAEPLVERWRAVFKLRASVVFVIYHEEKERRRCRMKILVVADHPSVSSMLELVFSKEGIQGEFAADGLEGYRKYKDG